ncbi:hypothetical protein GE061_009199 [Apolygus lucorum]|uniref:E3 ubiquitin-protein ligase MARCHF5 n=1 Tax=Apolygus lucorum TaxID=248454 RepID=A0A6A4JTW7_APOLU|nr:hypothetical protein GE061_009199 [Apolygus lucorum]
MSQSNKSDPKKPNSKDNKNKPVPVSEGLSADTSEEVVSAVNQYFGIGRDPSTTTAFNKKTGNEHEDIVDKAPSEKNNQAAPVSTREDSDLRKPETSKSSTSKPSQSQAHNIRSARDQNTGRILTRSVSDKLFDQKHQGSENVSLDPTESVVSIVTQSFGIGQDEKAAKKPTNVHNDQIVAVSQQVIDNHDTPNEAKKQTSNSKVPSTVTAKQKSSPETSTKGDNLSAERKTSPESTGRKSHPVIDSTFDDHKNVRRLTETKEPSSKRVTIVPTVESTPSESVVSAVTDFFGISNSAPISSPVSKMNVAPQQPITGARSNLKDSRQQDETKVASKTNPDPVGKVQPSSPGFSNEGETTRTIKTGDTADSKGTPTVATAATKPSTPQKSPTPLPRKAMESKVLPPSTTSAKGPEKGGASKVETPAPSTLGLTPSESVVTAVTDYFGISNSAPISAPISKQNIASQQPITGTPVNLKDPRKLEEKKVAPKTNLDTAGKVQPDSTAANNENVIKTGQDVSESPDSKYTPIGAAVASKVITTQKASTPQVTKAADKNSPLVNSTKGSDKVVAGKVETSAPSSIGVTPSESVVTAVTDFFGISHSVSTGATMQTGPQQTTTAKETPPGATVAPIAVVSPQTNKDNKKPYTSTAPQPEKKPEPIKPPLGFTSQAHQSQTASADESKSPLMSKYPDSKVPQTSTSSVKNLNVAANEIITPKDQTDINLKTSSKLTSPSNVYINKSPPVSVDINKGGKDGVGLPISDIGTGEQNAETPRTMDEAKQPIATGARSLLSPLAVQGTDSPGSKDPKFQSIPTSRISDDNKISGSTKTLPSSPPSQGEIDAISSTGKSQPVVVASSGKSHPVVPSKTETSRTLNEQTIPETVETTSNTPSSSPVTVKNIPPVVVSTQDIGTSKGKSSNFPEDRVAQEPSKATDLKAHSVPTDVKQHPQQVAGSPKIVPSSPPSQAAVNVGNITGQSQPIAVASSEKSEPVSASMTETPRTLNEQNFPEPITTYSNVSPSSPATATNMPPVAVVAQGTSNNKGRSSNLPEDRTALESSKAVDSKAHPVLAAASLQSQTVAANSIETPRTFEGQRSLGTSSSASTKPAVPAGAEVNTIPVPVTGNAIDRRSNKVHNMNVPPSPIQSTAPSAGVSHTGSAALTGITSPNRGSYTSTGTARQCWICFATDEDELGMHWIQPCKCKGTTKWVHQSCLQMWVDEKLREHKEKKVACPQCRTEYLIYLPQANILVRSLDQVDNVIYRICPFIAAGVVIGSFYWNAVTYGAIVMLQVAGSEGAGAVMETFQPTVIIVGLPFIPLSLIVFRLFQWEDSFLYILRTTSHCIPPLQYLLPGHVMNETGMVTDAPETTAMSFQRVLAGALLTPVIAKICGNLFFRSVESPVWRTLFGGALFISVKGLIKMYHKQQTYKRLSRRKILDYTEENKRIIEMSRPVMMSPVAPTPLRFQFVASVERRTRRR